MRRKIPKGYENKNRKEKNTPRATKPAENLQAWETQGTGECIASSNYLFIPRIGTHRPPVGGEMRISSSCDENTTARSVALSSWEE